MLRGREAELRELLGAAAAAVDDGRGFLALVMGDAGIGKTRLAAEFAARMRADGVPVAWAACRQDGGAPPYWPWAQLLDRLGRPDALRPATPSDDPELARFTLFASVGRVLREAAPVVLVLDDLHWADQPSLRLLEALDAHVGPAAVLVLGTYRDTEPGGAARLPAERRIVLRGLPADELGAAVADATGEQIGGDLASALHRRTGGNPFFAAEVVRMLRGEGSVDVESALPSGVLAVLERRLDQLPDGPEPVLRAAAALDAGVTTGCSGALLAAVGEIVPAELDALLVPAVEAGLIVRQAERYRFPHALVADTLTSRTPPAQRLELHRRAAAVLGGRPGAATAAAAQLMAAARLSGDPDDASAATTAGAVAARVAMGAAAYEDAVDWLGRCLAVAVEGAARGELLCALGEATLATGDAGAARDAFTDAAVHARLHGRTDLLAAAALGLTGGAAGFEVDLADPGRLALLEEALAALPGAESAVRVALSARLSVALAFTDGEHRRRTLADDAVAMARQLDDPRSLTVALAALCDAIAGPDHVAERLAAAAEIVTAARRAGDPLRELLGRRLRLVALAETGRWPEVDAEIDAYAAAVAPLRRPGLAWLVPLWSATRATMRGDTDAGRARQAELAGMVERSGSVNAELLMLTQRFVVETVAGRAMVHDGLDRFLVLAPESPASAYCTWALLRAVRGEPGAADLLDRFLDARAGTVRDSEWVPEMVQAAQVAVLVGDHAAAATVYAALRPYTGLFAIEGILAGTWGCVDGHLGRLARLLGDEPASAEHLAAAVRLDAAAGAALGARTRAWVDQVPEPDGEPTFRRDGEIWTLSFAGRAVALRDTKGLHDLAALLARPGAELAVQELTGSTGADAAPVELVDRTAIAAYRRRLTELADDLAEAQNDHDPVRAERAAAERDALVDELAVVTGLGGRPRRAGSDAERMRKAVGNRIRQALARIEAVHPELGRHLRVAVRTGTFCRYAPEHPVRWRL